MLRIGIVAVLFAQTITPQCGGGNSGSSSNVQNFQAIAVNAGPANNYFNGAFTTVTVCVPGSSSCQTIDGMLVDTGSSGVRVLANKLAGLSLQQQTDTGGGSIGECAQFADGFTWGPVMTADIRLGAEQASGVPIQVMSAPGFAPVPTACANSGVEEDTLDALGANGILGVGIFRQDCGPACTFSGSSNPGLYFACGSSGCAVTTETLTRQVQNPVWLFPSDNNGVAIQLPAVPAGGAAVSSGMIAFGIGTQNDNALGSARVLTLDGDGNFTTAYAGQSYNSSYIDSGSNGVFFLDSATTGLPICRMSKDFYCPPTLQTISVTLRGLNNVSIPATFAAGNVDTLPDPFTAFSEVTGPNPGAFDFGLSFFFGKTIFTAIEGQTTPGGVGPYYAY